MGEIGAAVKSIILFNKRALIIRRSNYIDSGENVWEFTGGGLRFGEGLEEGLLREISEETGLTVRVDRLLYASTAQISPQRQIVILTYLSHADTDTVVLSHEHKDFIWATRKQLKDMLDPPILRDLMKGVELDALGIE